MKNTLPDLRDHLFEVIERLKEGDIDLQTAQAINGVAQTLVASAKVEVDFYKLTDHDPDKTFIMGKPMLPAPVVKRPG